MIRILQAGDEAALEAFLEPIIESSMFLVGNMRAAGLEDKGEVYQGTYAAVFDGQRIIGAVALFWNGSLVLQAPPALLNGLWQTAAVGAQYPIMRVVGPKQQVQTVLDSLDIAAADIQMDEPQYLYSLRLAEMQIPLPLASGEWHGRLVNTADIELMTRWRIGYALELLGETESPELWRQMREGVERYGLRGDSWILEDKGRPVSTSSFNTRIKKIVQVGGVWTPPELRSRGYGRGAVAASLLSEREKGVHLAILFTGEANIPAQKAYEALGFELIGDYRFTLLKEEKRIVSDQ